MDDTQLFETIRTRLFTAVVGDVLDVLGHRHQFLPQGILPLDPGTKLVGRAMPVLEADYPDGVDAGPLSDKPFGMMFAALDDLQPGEIYVATGASLDYALWGGLMSTRARHLKAAGAVLDGFIRDTAEIRRLGFPVFSRGAYAQDQGVRGKVLDCRVPVRIGHVDIHPGDLLFCDEEGVLVIPQICEQEAIERALDKAETESAVAKAIRGGMSAQHAFETFGVM
ncbi:regulator of RNase E activity RraA [Aliiruegeria haliotis]|uniref:Putative 4-hydroxy-4-methyl-2-oxoglutarate aldolase n=1 Tax=Aliiruegeria haliotis TaxID=1280846 RepID=A0A2T0RMY0_9RHOB|nr:RraA family protein [Aliiruegeria haliotis]PRY22487.1 regulator of RNase E activity RraA [Aliiruegeria haliotis]